MIRWKVLQLGATVSFFFLGEGGFAFSLFLSAWPAITSKHPVNLVHIFYSSSFLFLSFKKKKKKKRETKRTVCIPPTHTHTRLARLVFCLLFLPLFIVDVVWNHAVSSVFNDTNEVKVKNKEKKKTETNHDDLAVGELVEMEIVRLIFFFFLSREYASKSQNGFFTQWSLLTLAS